MTNESAVAQPFDEPARVPLAAHVLVQPGKHTKEAIIEALELPTLALVERFEIERHDHNGAVVEHVRTVQGPQSQDFHDGD
jgi:hypothetical protein